MARRADPGEVSEAKAKTWDWASGPDAMHPTDTEACGEPGLSLSTDLNAPLVVGLGMVLPLAGVFEESDWDGRDVRRITVLVDGAPRAEGTLLLRHGTTGDGMAGGPIERRFVALVPFGPVEAPTQAQLALRVRLAGGTQHEIPLDSVTLLPSPPLGRETTADSHTTLPTGQPRVAICMATYNPPMDLFEQQIASIRAQTHTNWVCLVSDDCSEPKIYGAVERLLAGDDRFRLHRNDARLGFYANFERCLAYVPPEAEFVALADQDDVWYPDKLRSLLAAFGPETSLVYSDMHIVARDGTLVHDTYWTSRRNNYTDFAALIWANTVTGAASVFRADLLRDALPFPPRVGQLFHDHWVACVAMARGEIAYVDAPLYAYRQHAGNVIGHTAALPARRPRISSIVRSLISPAYFKAKLTAILWSRLDGYDLNVLRTALVGKTLQLRGLAASEPKRRIVDELARVDCSLAALLRESGRTRLHHRPTYGTEWYATRGSIANRLLCCSKRIHACARLWTGLSRLSRGREGGWL